MTFLCVISCSKPQKNGQITAQDDQYYSIVNSLDTLKMTQKRVVLDSVLSEFNTSTQNQTSSYLFFKAFNCFYKAETDSVEYFLGLMPTDQLLEWQILKSYLSLLIDLNNSNKIVSSDIMSKILNTVNIAEQNNSKFTYLLYDLMARAYFNNKDIQKSLSYTNLWINSNPHKNSPLIRQRYFDISFLLAQQIQDISGMKSAIDSAYNLAISIQDSAAIIRVFDSRAQLNSAEKNFEEALKNIKHAYNLRQKSNKTDITTLNNVAVTFLRNKQVDSAIVYYNKAIAFAKERNPNSNLKSIYDGLHNAYNIKKEYRNAYIALDSMQSIDRRNHLAIQAEKIEELYTQYETEKKDLTIAGLRKDKELIEKSYTSQRLILGILILFLIFIIVIIRGFYRSKILKTENEKLLIDNNKLKLEQKLNQVQLNPHFVHNTLANLQGLIYNGNKEDANRYLFALSRYIRDTLELNRHEFITLNEEIESITNYLQMQQMRFKDSFNFEIAINEIDTNVYIIPPMILQPFIENSIEHGFKNINYKGLLLIEFGSENEQLLIQINDNGSDSDQPSNKKSLSTVIIKERLDLLFNTSGINKAYLDAHTLTKNGQSCGYEVRIKMPLLKD